MPKGGSEPGEESLPSRALHLPLYAGPLEIDPSSSILSPVHYAAKQYSQRSWSRPFRDAQFYLVSICSRYLLFSLLVEVHCLSGTPAELTHCPGGSSLQVLGNHPQSRIESAYRCVLFTRHTFETKDQPRTLSYSQEQSEYDRRSPTTRVSTGASCAKSLKRLAVNCRQGTSRVPSFSSCVRFSCYMYSAAAQYFNTRR